MSLAGAATHWQCRTAIHRDVGEMESWLNGAEAAMVD